MKVWKTVALVCTPLLLGAAWLGAELVSSPIEPVLGEAIHLIVPKSDPTPDVPVADDPGDAGAIAVPPADSCLAGDDADDELDADLDDVPDVGDCED